MLFSSFLFKFSNKIINVQNTTSGNDAIVGLGGNDQIFVNVRVG
jgi:hypothetical protein